MTDATVDTAETYVARGKRQADAALETAREYGSAIEDEISERPLTLWLWPSALVIGYSCVVG